MSGAPRARRGLLRETELGAWRRVVFLSGTGTLAIVLTAAVTQAWDATDGQWTTFWLLASLAAATDFLGVRGARERVYGTAAVFVVAAAIILPIQFAPFVAVPACLIHALRGRSSPFSLLHNAFAAALATLAASAVAHSSSEQPTALRAGLLLAAALVYSLCATGLDDLFGRVERSPRVPALAFDRLGTEVVLALLGVALATFWAADPWRIPLALAPLVLVRRLQGLPRLEQEAVTDAKTGLMNVRRFDEGLQTALTRARAEKRPLSLIVVDLDLLREINNEHGHLVGDAVIRGISDVLRQQIRKDDLAARFGGEEFVLALPDTPPERAVRIAERIREAVASRVFAGEQPPVATRATVSAGVAAFPRDALAPRGLIHAADLAVLAAKARGRNRVVDAAEIRIGERQNRLRQIAR